MAERSTSLTLPQNRPDGDEPSPTSATTANGIDVKVEATPGTGAGGVGDNLASEVATGTNDPKAVESPDVAGDNGTPSPIKDSASIVTADTQPRYKFSRKENEKSLRFITKAHAASPTDSAPAFKDDKDIITLTQMVSQMTHLLAASGVGKDTTARALAYLNGPDQLGPKAALLEAKRDRRKKNQRRANTGTVKPAGNTDAASEIKSRTTGSKTNSDQDVAPADPKATPSTTTASTSGEITDRDAATINGNKTESSNEVKVAKDDVVKTEALQDAGKTDKPKKRFGRPNWTWRSRRRNANKSKDKNGEKGEKKVDVVQDQAVASTDSTKEPMVTIEEQKDNSDNAAPTQVAPAA